MMTPFVIQDSAVFRTLCPTQDREIEYGGTYYTQGCGIDFCRIDALFRSCDYTEQG